MNLVLQTCLCGDALNFCRLSFCECFDHGPGYDCQWGHDGCSGRVSSFYGCHRPRRCPSVETDVDLHTDQVDTNFSSCVHGDIPTESPRVIEMWKLGGMSKPVMHNDVAPGQLEISPKLSVRTFLSQCASKHVYVAAHKNLLRTLTDLENVVIEGRTQTLDETFACLGRRAKSSKSLSSSSRSWRTSLTFVGHPARMFHTR